MPQTISMQKGCHNGGDEMKDLCMNHLVYETGRCDYCDARCPDYIGISELAHVMYEFCKNGSEDVKAALSVAHDKTLQRIHREYIEGQGGQ